ncbi:MAG: SAM-dependent methyltransferase [Flavobacteriales bacterium]|jgi:SAM-dependent methyltransferase
MSEVLRAVPEWFEAWFDSPYYALLYRHRNRDEAASFLDLLIEEAGLKPGNRVLDLACGQGRHSIHLAARGLDVMGIDLSARSIEVAAASARPGLRFERADMREFQIDRIFDAILNLFTSFGYFGAERENHQVLERAALHLKPKGIFVLDYLNSIQVRARLVPLEEVMRDGIRFIISRRIESMHVVKEIHVEDGDYRFSFMERVQLFDLPTLLAMLGTHGLKVTHTFGDYRLGPFDAAESERLILVAQKE